VAYFIASADQLSLGGGIPSGIAPECDIQRDVTDPDRIDPLQAGDTIKEYGIVYRGIAERLHAKPLNNVNAAGAGGVRHHQFDARMFGFTHPCAG
jgi:hypothetical protein